MAVLKLVFISLLSGVLTNDYVRMCYYNYWSQYRDEFKFLPENIDPDLCSHIVIAFAKLSLDQLLPVEWIVEGMESVKGIYERLTNLKTKSKDMKVLLALGNWSEGIGPTTASFSTLENRSEFVRTSIKFLKKYKLDGLDLDIRYQLSRKSAQRDKKRFMLLLQQLSKAFILENFLLTASVPTRIENGYEIDKIGTYLDYVKVMTYNFNGAWDKATGHHSPLYPSRGDTFDTDRAIRRWRDSGLPSKKLLVGMTTYGRCFTLSIPRKGKMVAAVSGVCPVGNYTKEAGMLAYYEICTVLRNPSSKKKLFNDRGAPHVISGSTWIGYDDVTSLTKKAEYLRKYNFGGWFLWELSLDDFLGTQCGQGKYPLLKALNQATMTDLNLHKGKVQPEAVIESVDGVKVQEKTIKTPVTSWHRMVRIKRVEPNQTETTTENNPYTEMCRGKKDGRYTIPRNCRAYISCENGTGEIGRCNSQNEYFSDTKDECVFELELSPLRKKECLIEISTGDPELDLICKEKKRDGNYSYEGDCRTFITCSGGKGDTNYCLRYYFFDEGQNKCVPEKKISYERQLECNQLRRSDTAQVRGSRATSLVQRGMLILSISLSLLALMLALN